jgi:phage shock protein A
MGIFKKLSDVARVHLNSFLNQIEDKRKLSLQAIMDLETSKKKARKLLVSAMGSLKLATHQNLQLKTKIAYLKNEAEQFLKENNETKAKEILSEKQSLVQEVAAYEKQIKREQETVSTLNQGLSAIDKKIKALKRSSAISSGHDQAQQEDAFDVFSRMEEKIDIAEKEVEALNELLVLSQKKDTEDQNLSAPPFDKYSDPAALEKELAAMKKKIKD